MKIWLVLLFFIFGGMCWAEEYYGVTELLMWENNRTEFFKGDLVNKQINGSFEIIAKAAKNGWIIETDDSVFGGNNRMYYLKIPQKWLLLGNKPATGQPDWDGSSAWFLAVIATNKYFKYVNNFGGENKLRILELKMVAYPKK